MSKCQKYIYVRIGLAELCLAEIPRTLSTPTCNSLENENKFLFQLFKGSSRTWSRMCHKFRFYLASRYTRNSAVFDFSRYPCASAVRCYESSGGEGKELHPQQYLKHAQPEIQTREHLQSMATAVMHYILLLLMWLQTFANRLLKFQINITWIGSLLNCRAELSHTLRITTLQ